MAWSVRIGTVVIVAGGLLVGAIYADQRILASLAKDLWDLPANQWELRRQRYRCEDLCAQQEATRQRLERKQRIAQALLEGQIDLREAARQFMEASKDCPYQWDTLVEPHPDWSVERRCAYYVIDGVRAELRDQGQDPTAAVNRLQREVDHWTDD